METNKSGFKLDGTDPIIYSTHKEPELKVDYDRVPEDQIPAKIKLDAPEMQAFKKGPVRILLNRSEKFKAYPEQATETCVHLSISCEDRYPTWPEVEEARARFLKRDRDVYMILPADHRKIARMPFCFHLYLANLIDKDGR